MFKEWTDWEQWLVRQGPVALLYARQFTRSPADAEDVVNDAFLRFWPKRDEARSAEAFFLAGVRSAALDRRRSESRRRRRHKELAENKPLFEVPDVMGFARREEIESALDGLPEEQREALVLKIWGGMTFSQIAEMCGESMSTVAASVMPCDREAGAVLLTPEVRHV